MRRRSATALLLLTLLPLLFSVIVMIREVGGEALLQGLNGQHSCPPGDRCNPIAKVVLGLSASSLLLGLFGILAVNGSRRFWQTRTPAALKITAHILVALTNGVVFRYATGVLMPLIWLPEFGDYLLGLPASPTALAASWYVIFPLSTLAVVLGPPWVGHRGPN
jgi:hypothetical protein